MSGFSINNKDWILNKIFDSELNGNDYCVIGGGPMDDELKKFLRTEYDYTIDEFSDFDVVSWNYER